MCVAMEGFGGCARPFDSQVLAQGWRQYAINNLKFARFEEIFPAPAKTDAIDARRKLQPMQMLELLNDTHHGCHVLHRDHLHGHRNLFYDHDLHDDPGLSDSHHHGLCKAQYSNHSNQSPLSLEVAIVFS